MSLLTKCSIFIVTSLVLGSSVMAQESLEQFLHHFDYKRSASLDFEQVDVQDWGGIKIYNLSYASPRGGRVPAFLVVPEGKGPHAAILFGHWLLAGSPMRNRREFLDEAVILARAGAISILIDAPMVRPGAVENPDPLSSQNLAVDEQQVVDFRRALDLLTSRDDVDPARIAFVGHSFDAKIGAILAGIEKRISFFVLMAGSCGDEYYVFHNTNPGILRMRKEVGDATLREFFRRNAWDDPSNYVGQSAPASVFLQFASEDGPAGYPQHCYEAFDQPKTMKVYEASHALNAAARKDRVQWLVERLHLHPIDISALEQIPPLK